MLGAYALVISSARAETADVPAIIVNPTAAGRRELSHVIRDALHGVPVTLADDALTTSSIVAITHANLRDAAGRPLNGRDLSRPDTFALFKHESNCVLVHSKTGRAWTLQHSRCAAISPASAPP